MFTALEILFFYSWHILEQLDFQHKLTSLTKWFQSNLRSTLPATGELQYRSQATRHVVKKFTGH